MNILIQYYTCWNSGRSPVTDTAQPSDRLHTHLVTVPADVILVLQYHHRRFVPSGRAYLVEYETVFPYLLVLPPLLSRLEIPVQCAHTRVGIRGRRAVDVVAADEFGILMDTIPFEERLQVIDLVPYYIYTIRTYYLDDICIIFTYCVHTIYILYTSQILIYIYYIHSIYIPYTCNMSKCCYL